MAKFSGYVGFAVLTETAPSVWVEKITKRLYYGDIIKNFRRLSPSEHLNDNVSISNEISIVADPYAYENFHAIRYVDFMGVKWKVTNVEVQYPRLFLTMGDVYHEEQTE